MVGSRECVGSLYDIKVLRGMNMRTKSYIKYFFIIILILISCCNKKDYPSLIDVPQNQEQWIPVFFRDNQEIYNHVYNYSEYHDLDTNETWGYFSMDVQSSNFWDNNQINNDIIINKKKLEKQIKKLGYSEEIKNGKYLQYEKSIYFLIFDNNTHKFYFFGKYK